jgi:hypothetical protein
MIGKKFTSLTDGRVVEVKDAFEDIIILQDGSKIKASRLMDRSFYDEYIDPNSFFQNQSLLNTFAQKIKQIPEDVVNKMSNEDKLSINENLRSDGLKPRFDEPAILQADPEMEKMELMRKYGISDTSQNPNPLVESKKQMERFASILQELQEEVEEEETIQRVEVTREENIFENRSNEIGKTNEIIQEDPIITMFKNVKRNREFKITIDLENKIPRPDFIEMMEDSYNTSLIEFLATEFTNSILDNPDIIKNKIISEINNIVYGNKIKEEKVEVKAETKTVKSRTPRQKKLI